MITIYAIPGLGTTGELFKYLSLEGYKIHVLNWPNLTKEETMQSLAQKFSLQINHSEPFYLMGVSFGGMLCSELSLISQPIKTILISSCKSPSEFPTLINFFRATQLHKLFPDSWIRFVARHSRKVLGFEKKFMPEYIEMVNSMAKNYFKYSLNVIINWKLSPHKFKNLIHIHGDADDLLRYKNVQADLTIKDGNHAMIVNDANEISNLLKLHL